MPSTTDRQDRPASEPKKSAPDLMRKALAVSALCALGSGCAGAPVRPEPGECPRTAINAMRDELGLGLPAGLSLAIDVHQKGDAHEYAPGVYREGPITGLVIRGREKLMEGTTLKERLWLAKGDADSPLGYVVGRYTEAQLPDGRHLPVCIVLADPTAQPGFPIREGAGDGVALTLRWGPATAVSRWP